MKKSIFILALAAGMLWQADAREVVSLSGSGWKLWRDTAAQWQSEHVVVPGTPLDQITAHQPTGGWDALSKADRKDVTVPGTVEQYFTDMSALEKDYTIDPKNFWQPLQGVSWWSRTFKVDQDLTGKKVFLRFSALTYQSPASSRKATPPRSTSASPTPAATTTGPTTSRSPGTASS